MDVRVSPPNPSWRSQFELEATCIRAALNVHGLELHHIGSTAIEGIFAKPIIDILLVVDDLTTLDEKSSAMSALGYEALGEFGIAGRRYFRKNSSSGVRTHQVHSFARGTIDVARHLAFRDYMNLNPVVAQAYSSLKQQLASSFPQDIQAYMDGKDEFIKHHEALALAKHPSCGAA